MAFNKYQVIKNAISYELANFIFNYFLLKRDAVKYMYQNNITMIQVCLVHGRSTNSKHYFSLC